MDNQKFDSLVQSLGTGASRRQILKGLGVVGGLTAVAGFGAQAEARKKRVQSEEHGDCHVGDCTFGGNPRRTTCVSTTTVDETRTQPCEVGNSGRQGTQEGTVTVTSTTTTVFNGSSCTVRSTDTDTSDGPFTPTGPCRNNPGPQPR